MSENNRNNKVIHLFQYLLVKHGQSVRQDELISRLFLDADDYDNPVHTLKNIVYRLRKFLKESGLPDAEYIYFKKGAYGLNDEIECTIDADEFEKAVQKAKAASTQEERFDHCIEAVALYTGDFLPKSSNMFWVAPKSLRYQEEFRYCVDTANYILCEKQKLPDMLDVLEKALYLYPYEEHFHVLRISCLFNLGRVKEAVSEYDFATTLLFDELGVNPSEEMRELYDEITQTLNVTTESIGAILNDLNENIMEKGAYYCNYHSFVNMYRFVVRHAERSGRSAFLLLINFGGNEEAKDGKKQTESSALYNSIKISLRRGDVFARYSPSQFIVLLMDINQENCKKVTSRITQNFYRQTKSKNLSCKITSAIDVDRVLPLPTQKSERESVYS